MTEEGKEQSENIEMKPPVLAKLPGLVVRNPPILTETPPPGRTELLKPEKPALAPEPPTPKIENSNPVMQEAVQTVIDGMSNPNWGNAFETMLREHSGDVTLLARRLFVSLQIALVDIDRLKESLTMLDKGDKRIVKPLQIGQMCIIKSANPESRKIYKKYLVMAKRSKEPLFLLADEPDEIVICEPKQVRVKRVREGGRVHHG